MGRLGGRVVATTRDGRSDDPLVLALRAEGAEVRIWPTLAIAGPADAAALDAALSAPERFDWIAVTSARAVDPLADRAAAPTERPEGRPRVAAVGEATARALAERGWPVDLVGEGGGADGLVAALAEVGVGQGAHVLFPAGSLARDVLEDGLRALGAEVLRVEAYRTTPRPPDGPRVRADVAGGVHVVTFASPSAVQALDEALDGHLAAALAPCAVAAIGPTTAEALRVTGRRHVLVAADASVEALVEVCVASCGIRGGPQGRPGRRT